MFFKTWLYCFSLGYAIFYKEIKQSSQTVSTQQPSSYDLTVSRRIRYGCAASEPDITSDF